MLFFILLFSCSNENEKKLEECRLACDAKQQKHQRDYCEKYSEFSDPDECIDKYNKAYWIPCLKQCKLRWGQ